MISLPRSYDILDTRICPTDRMDTILTQRDNITPRVHHYGSIYCLREDRLAYHCPTLSSHESLCGDRIGEITDRRRRIGESIICLMARDRYHLSATRCEK